MTDETIKHCEICGTTKGVLYNWNHTGWRCSQHSTHDPTLNQTNTWTYDTESPES